MKILIAQFQQVNELQTQLLALCEEKSLAIEKKQIQEANALIKKELFVLHDLERALEGLKEKISMACQEVGIPLGKIETLYPHLTVEEREQLMACHRYAINCEKILKNKLKNAQRQVDVAMALPEILHRTRLQHLEEHGMDTTIYNQKF